MKTSRQTAMKQTLYGIAMMSLLCCLALMAACDAMPDMRLPEYSMKTEELRRELEQRYHAEDVSIDASVVRNDTATTRFLTITVKNEEAQPGDENALAAQGREIAGRVFAVLKNKGDYHSIKVKFLTEKRGLIRTSRANTFSYDTAELH